MKAAIIEQFGDANVMNLTEIDVPIPHEREVIVKVHSTSVNFADILTRRGSFHAAGTFPILLGLEAVGEVSAVGEGVEDLTVGDKVMCLPKKGSYAEYIAVDDVLCFKLPTDGAFEKFAGAPIVALTSYFLIQKVGQLGEGQTVIIHSGAGGIGTTCIQLAKYLGAANIIVTVGDIEKAEPLYALGATQVLCYNDPLFMEKIESMTKTAPIDVILDPLGGELTPLLLKNLANYGRYVIYGSASGGYAHIDTGMLHASCKSVLGFSIATTRNQRPQLLKEAADFVIDLIHRNELQIHVGQEFTLDEVTQAHQLLETRKHSGKIIINC